MGQAWFPHTRLDRHLISQLNAHSQSPSLSYTPLCSFSNPLFLSLSCSLSIISFFPQSLILTPSISPWTLLHFSISYLSFCHTIHCPSEIFHPTSLSPRHSLLHFLFRAHLINTSILQEQSSWLTLSRHNPVSLWPYILVHKPPVKTNIIMWPQFQAGKHFVLIIQNDTKMYRLHYPEAQRALTVCLSRVINVAVLQAVLHPL